RPGAGAGAETRPRAGRDRCLSVDQGPGRQRRALPRRASRRPGLAQVRGGAGQREPPGTSGTLAAPPRPRVTRRGIQIALGLLWLLDGLLQFQPAMLTSKFAVEVIAPAGAGQPGFIAGPVGEVVRIILHRPVITDVIFGLFQLALS